MYAQANPGTTFYEYVFAGNSLYDPDVTGVGGQPTGFDQLSNFYNKYRVMSSSISVTFINTASVGTLVTIIPTDTAGGVSGATDAASSPYSKWGVVANANGANRLTLVNSISTSKIFGTDASQDDLFSATTSANPSNIWFWVINMDSSSNILIMMTVRIVYTARLYKRVALDQS